MFWVQNLPHTSVCGAWLRTRQRHWCQACLATPVRRVCTRARHPPPRGNGGTNAKDRLPSKASLTRGLRTVQREAKVLVGQLRSGSAG